MTPMTMLSDGVVALRAMTAGGLNRWSGILRLTSGDDAPAIISRVAGSPGRRVAGSPGRRVAGSPGRRVAGSPGRRVAGSPGRRVAGLPGCRVAGSPYLRVRFCHERARIAGPLPPAGLPA